MTDATREDLICPECGKECASPAGYGAHRRYKHGVKKSPPLTPSAPAGEAGAASPVTFRSPRAPELRVVVKKSDRILIPTPAGTLQEVRQGKTAEFRDGLFTTDDPEVIDFLENKYQDNRYPIISQRVLRKMADAC